MDGKGREMKEKEKNAENKVKCRRKGIKGVGVLWLYDKEKGTGVFGFPLCDSNITPPPPPLPAPTLSPLLSPQSLLDLGRVNISEWRESVC